MNEVKNKFKTIPISLKAANEFVTTHHRHNKKTAGHKFSIGAMLDGELIGVAICGRPVARALDNGTTLEVLRVCIKDPAPRNACSYLYARCQKIWTAMGGEKIITYTLESEPGSSLKAVNWLVAATTKKRAAKNLWNTRRPEHAGYKAVREAQIADGVIKNRWEKLI
jgi:hypothetical protein|tara:strand:- start:2190 stop:2690 length:501 start_codon:yes stop_codon:yes gene_type:complete